MTGGAPATTSAPPARATTPAAIAGATSGTTSRLTSGDRIASRPNETRTIGSVAAWAASETPRLSASQPGMRPRAQASSQLGERRGPGDQPGRRQRRELEPGIADRARGRETSRSVAAQPSAAAARPARPVSRARRTTPAISAARTTDADAPGERDVDDDRDDGHDRSAPSAETAGHRRDRGGDDRDVPAGDGDDVADAGRRERRGEVAIDQVAQADEDAGRQSGFRLRAGHGSSASAAPRRSASRRRAGSSGAGCDREGPRRQRPDRTDPQQVVAVRRIGPRPDRAVDDDPVAGIDDRIAGQRRRDPERTVGVRRASRASRSAWPSRGEPVDSTTSRHGPSPSGGVARAARLRPGQPPAGSRSAPRRRRPAAAPRRPNRGRASPTSRIAGERQRDRGPEMTRRDLSGSDCRRDRAEREAAAPAHLSAPSRGP